MKDLKIGQEVLIKAKVVEHNKHDKAIAINKQGGIVERFVYVDDDSVLTPYVTTKELVDWLEDFEGVELEEHNWFGFEGLGIYYKDMHSDPIFVAFGYNNIVIIPDELLCDSYAEYEWECDIQLLLEKLFRYAQTPIELRENAFFNQQ